MKRRRFITFGLILAMALSLGTVGYLMWFVSEHERDVKPTFSFFWESGPDHLIISDSRDLIIVWAGYTLRCEKCHKRHSYDEDCNGIILQGLPSVVPDELGRINFAISAIGQGRNLVVWFPPWLPIPVLATYPVIYLAWGFRRRRPGHCLHCDYDLTGNKSGMCPECGTEIENATV